MWAKSLAAVFLGLPLAVGLIGLIALAWPGSFEIKTLPWLMMFFPIWILAMSFPFQCKSGLRAWCWMGLATLVCFGAIFVLKHIGWVVLPS